MGIPPDETTCMQLPTSAPGQKNLSLDNVARYIDIDVVKSNKRLAIYHNLVCLASIRPHIGAFEPYVCII